MLLTFSAITAVPVESIKFHTFFFINMYIVLHMQMQLLIHRASLHISLVQNGQSNQMLLLVKSDSIKNYLANLAVS